MPELAHWDTFCVIVGSAAGALIGLQFVVLTLIAQRPPVRGEEAGAAFATPTIVHFAAVLLVAVVLRMPWHSVTSVGGMCGIVGFAGVVYVAIVVRRMRTQGAYQPVLDDWVYHAAVPFVGYVMLAISGLALPANEHDALFCIAAAALVLLFTGIRNAWDAIVYHALASKPQG
jgi:hypothetical protein